MRMRELVVVFFTLVYLALSVHGVAQQHSLSAVTTDQIAVTAGTLDTSTNFAIVILSKPTSYNGDGTGGNFDLYFNVTYSGFMPDFVVNNFYGVVSFTGPGILYTESYTGCAQEKVVGASLYARDTQMLTYHVGSLVRLTATGSFTGTISYYTTSYSPATTATFTFTNSGAYSPPLKPTLQSLILSPQASLAPQLNLTLTPSSITAGSYEIDVQFLPVSAPLGVAYSSFCVTTTGFCGPNDWSDFVALTAGWCDDEPDEGSAVPGISAQQGVALSLRSVAVSNADFLNAFGPSDFTGNTQLTVNAGSADTTPPTCTSLTFAHDVVNTGNSDVPVDATISCADESGGSGIQVTGAILRAQSGSISQDISLLSPQLTYDVPPGYTGTVSVIGVFAIDGAGNAVLYGSCGNLGNYFGLQTVCGGTGGGSSSSATTVVASLLSALVVALGLLVL